MKEMNAPPEVEVFVYNQNNSAIHYDDCFQNRLKLRRSDYVYMYISTHLYIALGIEKNSNIDLSERYHNKRVETESTGKEKKTRNL